MIKKTLYPKTKRVQKEKKGIRLTEKLDGSNIGFFNQNGRLLISQRNNVFYLDELDSECSKQMYNGLYGWLVEHGKELLENLYLDSGVFCEWIGMGKIKYENSLGGIKAHIFAKARIDKDMNVSNIVYDIDFLKYAFSGNSAYNGDRTIPSFMRTVPLVYEVYEYPTVKKLDDLYEQYCAIVGRKVEGFVVNNNNSITKYVRYKNGKLTEHKS